MVGATLGIMGLVLVFWPDLAHFDLGGARRMAIAEAFGATFLFSLGNIVSARNHDAGLPVLPSIAYGMGYGALFLFLLAFFRRQGVHFDPSFPYVASLLYLAIFGSVVRYGTYLALIGRIGPARTAYAMTVVPIIAFCFSTLFEGFVWTSFAFFGVALILLGNLVVQTRRGGQSGGARRSVSAGETKRS